MPFKIYTYADPYRITQTDFWDEIKYYPHLCASRTLARGLMNILPSDEIQTLFCPLDEIVNNRIFTDWTKNIGRRIQQYSELGQKYKYMHANVTEVGLVGDDQYEAFSHNKNSMLDSLRLFIELGIKSDSLDVQKLNMEHRVFAYLLKFAENERLFSLPKLPDKAGIIDCFIDQARQEKKDKEDNLRKSSNLGSINFQKELDVYDLMINRMSQWNGNNIVVHGIHQFTPLQLRLLTYLDKIGVEVIFLHNYIPELKEIYSSWDYIYQQFDAPIHHDRNIVAFHPSLEFPRPGTAIATNLALLCEEKKSRKDPQIIDNFKLYQNEKVIEFDNISEYAGYVSDLVSDAEMRLKNSRGGSNIRRQGTREVLKEMEDVIYTANKEVDDLLQIYHPEYARNRHFLSYPIGQFFVSLYSLWNIEKGEINIDYNLLRECVNSGILVEYNSEQVLKTLMNVEPLFSNIHLFSQFDRIFTNYKRQYDQVNNTTSSSAIFPLKMMNIYCADKVSAKEIDDLHQVVTDINDIAKKLFGNTDEDEQYEFGKHFQLLQDFVAKRHSALANEEEKDLISKLLIRLELVQKQINNGKGTLDDLRSGLYFFLKQKEEADNDWFVRNFEQIDGDVLLSLQQNGPGKKKIYHFACVSDKDMNRTVDELLPWPLSEMFIDKAYNPKELPFQVYYSSLGERSNYLRYALFYGLYFSRCDTKISYVKRYGDNTTDYYELLRLIGLKSAPRGYEDIAEIKSCPAKVTTEIPRINSLRYSHEQAAAMFLCPYKYFMDYVLNPHPTLSGSFLMQRFYINVLIENTWKSIQGKNQNEISTRISQEVNNESVKINQYFPFFTSSEFTDMKKQAENYISTHVLKAGSLRVRPLDSNHMQLRKTFGNAEFFEDLQNLPEEHYYSKFEQLARTKNDQKSYSTHSVPKTENKELIDCMLNYLNEVDNNLERPGTWCLYCPDKGVCLSSFRDNRE